MIEYKEREREKKIKKERECVLERKRDSERYKISEAIVNDEL